MKNKKKYQESKQECKVGFFKNKVALFTVTGLKLTCHKHEPG